MHGLHLLLQVFWIERPTHEPVWCEVLSWTIIRIRVLAILFQASQSVRPQSACGTLRAAIDLSKREIDWSCWNRFRGCQFDTRVHFHVKNYRGVEHSTWYYCIQAECVSQVCRLSRHATVNKKEASVSRALVHFFSHNIYVELCCAICWGQSQMPTWTQ